MRYATSSQAMKGWNLRVVCVLGAMHYSFVRYVQCTEYSSTCIIVGVVVGGGGAGTRDIRLLSELFRCTV